MFQTRYFCCLTTDVNLTSKDLINLYAKNEALGLNSMKMAGTNKCSGMKKIRKNTIKE